MTLDRTTQNKWDKSRIDAEQSKIDALIADLADDELAIAAEEVRKRNPNMATMLKGDPRKSRLLKSKICEWMKGSES